MLPLNQRVTTPIWHTLIPYQRLKLIFVAVPFFVTPIFSSEFDLTSTAYNYGLKPQNLENYHIFGILRTSAFRWTYPGFFFFDQISSNWRFSFHSFAVLQTAPDVTWTEIV